jgi:integrase
VGSSPAELIFHNSAEVKSLGLPTGVLSCGVSQGRKRVHTRFAPIIEETRIMPRLGQSIPKYRKHKSSGQAIVEINGHRTYLGPYGTKASRLEYDRIITEWLASGRSNSFGTPAHELTVVELIIDYVRHCRSYYGTGPNSEWRRVKRVVRPVRKLYGRTLVEEFTVIQFKAVRSKLVAEGLSRSYVNASMKRVVRMFKWAAGEGQLSHSVPQSLALVPGLRRGKSAVRETEPVLPVDDRLVDATLLHLPEVVADMVRFQRLSGCRPAEVCSIRPCDVDRSAEVWEYRPGSHKTAHHGKQRVIFLGPQAQAILLRYLARDSKAPCFQPADSEVKRRAIRHQSRRTPESCGNNLGTNRKRKPTRTSGEQYTTCSYGRAITRACAKAFPVPGDIVADATAITDWKRDHHWSPNRLRHTAATSIRKRYGLEAAQVVLGHAQANVTQIYAERDFELAARVAREVG